LKITSGEDGMNQAVIEEEEDGNTGDIYPVQERIEKGSSRVYPFRPHIYQGVNR
jgi:hypothetical protein